MEVLKHFAHGVVAHFWPGVIETFWAQKIQTKKIDKIHEDFELHYVFMYNIPNIYIIHKYNQNILV